jgi:hypothetical protein
MARAIHSGEDTLVWEQVAWDGKGNIIDKRTIPVTSENVGQEVEEYVEFLKNKGADLHRSVYSQIEHSRAMIDSLMREVRRTRSSEEVQPLRRSLNQAVELSKQLESVCRMFSVPPLEGTIRILRLDGSTEPTKGTFSVMFAPYNGPGGALRTRSFVGPAGTR